MYTQRSTWATLCWPKPEQSSVCNSSTSNQWNFKGLLKEWTKHMWPRWSTCQLKGVIQQLQARVNLFLAWQHRHSCKQRPFNLLRNVESAMTHSGKCDPLCFRYLLGRTCAMAVFNAPGGIVSQELMLLQALHIHPATHSYIIPPVAMLSSARKREVLNGAETINKGKHRWLFPMLKYKQKCHYQGQIAEAKPAFRVSRASVAVQL